MTVGMNERLLRPLGKIALIQQSLGCFCQSLFGLLPIIGLPFAVAAIVRFVRVSWYRGAEWNPAERYLYWGLRCAILGLLLSLAAFTVIVLEVQSAVD